MAVLRKEFYVMFLGSSIEEKKVLGYKYFFIELTPPHIFMENCQNCPVNSWYFFVRLSINSSSLI